MNEWRNELSVGFFMMLGGLQEKLLSLSGIYMAGTHYCRNLRTVKRCDDESV